MSSRGRSEMNAWMRKFGGVYARTEPAPVIGIFYGHLQAVQRRVVRGENPAPDALLARFARGQGRRGALPLPRRGLAGAGHHLSGNDARPAAGVDESDPARRASISRMRRGRGGRAGADAAESSSSAADASWPTTNRSCPVPATKTGMQVAAYVAQANVDPTPLLFARNAENIAKLRAAMEGVAPPIAVSDKPAALGDPDACAATRNT